MRTLIVAAIVLLVTTCSCSMGGSRGPLSPATTVPTPAPPGAVPPVARASDPVAVPATPSATGPASEPATIPPTVATPALPAASASPGAPSPSRPASPEPAATPVPLGCLRSRERDAFVGGLLDELRRRDRDAIASRMAARFRFVMEATDVALDPVVPSLAVKQLFGGVPDPEGNPWYQPLTRGARVTCVRAISLSDLSADSTFWPGWDLGVLSTGWGEDGKRGAIIVLGHRPGGRPVWLGLLSTMTEFELRR